MRRLLPLIIMALLLLPALARAADLPRTVLAFYDSRSESRLRFANVHQLATLPLNHLGLVVEPHDIHSPLPPIEGRNDVRGILVWVADGETPDPKRFWRYLEQAVDRGIKLAILGDLPMRAEKAAALELSDINPVLVKIGVEALGDWHPVTLGSTLAPRDTALVEFERRFDATLPAYSRFRAVNGARPWLSIREAEAPETANDQVIVGPRGGYASAGFIYFRDPAFLRTQWYLNPFEFFRQVFGTDELPKPDITTLNGRRIFYSHIDGDGWMNITSVPAYAKERLTSAEVILKEVAEGYPDLPVTVAPVAAELDPAWHGSPAAMDIARRFFALPNVEPASHTYSHPFQWSFFANYTPAREAPFAAIYRSSGQQRYSGSDPNAEDREAKAAKAAGLTTGYRIPRAYGDKPFDIDLEIGGALDFLRKLAPSGKPPRLVQWPGDTAPFALALQKTEDAGALNINGGDSRFDTEYPSYSHLAPFGLRRGGVLQIYATNSNENTYTELWTDRYFGQRYVRETWMNTESPRRVAPINLYYHIFSGEKPASLKAVQENLDWVRKQEVAPIHTYDFAAIVKGFFESRLESVGPQSWILRQRGDLQSLRFDGKLAELVLDYADSSGVLGFRRHQGALYVALDPAVAEPKITLVAPKDGADKLPRLIESRWRISAFGCEVAGCRMMVRGFGEGAMTWLATPGSQWLAALDDNGLPVAETKSQADMDGHLRVQLPALTGTAPLRLTLKQTAP